MRPGGRAGAHQVGIRSVGTGDAEVVGHRAVEQPRVLRDQRHLVANLCPGHRAQVVPADHDRAALRIKEAHQEGDNGALPGTGRTDDGE